MRRLAAALILTRLRAPPSLAQLRLFRRALLSVCGEGEAEAVLSRKQFEGVLLPLAESAPLLLSLQQREEGGGA